MTDTDRKIHPISGGLWGLPLGIGLAVFAINARWVSLSISSLVVLTLVGVVFGILWSSFGPAKKPKGAPPAPAVEPVPEPMVVASATEPEFDPVGDPQPAGELPPPGEPPPADFTDPAAPPDPGSG